MKIGILTKEFPPYVYGGAGVHVGNLVNELSKKNQVWVNYFGNKNFRKKNLTITGYSGCDKLSQPEKIKFKKLLEAQSIALQIAGTNPKFDIIHSHTWYTAFTGFLLKTLYNLPLVTTMHSLEPLRPWKADQLGTGYKISSWMEKLAIENADKIIAVSEGMKKDIVRCYNMPPSRIEVIYNGVDANQFKKTSTKSIFKKFHIDASRPYLLFVGRTTRQKGLKYLLEAFGKIKEPAQLVIISSSSDERIIHQEIKEKIHVLRRQGKIIHNIEKFISFNELSQFYSHASVFVCPSVYEPFGIINLEAMACETPVVASAVGGIPEVVVPHKTGLLVPFNPKNEKAFIAGLEKNINQLLNNSDQAKKMGVFGRQLVEKKFSWKNISNQTLAVYNKTLKN
ncbi:MAG: glycogen synthase [Patescibacteria group bacterium]|nr:glycogen synthase [Patescibacteria group bacterium]